MIVKHISAVLFGALFLNTACATDTTKVHFKNLELLDFSESPFGTDFGAERVWANPWTADIRLSCRETPAKRPCASETKCVGVWHSADWPEWLRQSPLGVLI